MRVFAGLEGLGVHGAVVGFGRDESPQAQTADERDRLVVAVRNTAAQALATPTPAVATRQVSSMKPNFSESRSS